MTSLSKLAALTATGLMVLGVAAFAPMSPVLADSPGQIEGGNIYQIENLTQKTAFANPATANACDEVEYSARLHNSEYGQLNTVTVSVSLPSTAATSNTSTITATSTNGSPLTTTATTTLNLTSSQTVSYVNGSTQLLDTNGNVLETLPDGITGSGVNIGSLAGSATEYINFKANIGCPPVPVAPVYTCNALTVTTTPATREVQANVTYTAQNGATFQNVVYNFGPGITPVTTTSTSQTYTYTNYGTFPVTATVDFTVNGTPQTSTNTNCAKTVSFVAPTPPPAAPAQLPNTGAGNVVGIFGATTVVGAVAHRLFTKRRLSRLNS